MEHIDKGKQFMSKQKFIDFDQYYNNFDVKSLVANIQEQIYQLTDALMKKRARDKKSVVEYQKISNDQFNQLFLKMVKEIEQEVQFDDKKKMYDFNGLYFLKNYLIHPSFVLNKMLMNTPNNQTLVMQILRAIFVISRKNGYLTIIQMIERSQATTITRNCLEIFKVKEIEEVSKSVSQILTEQISTQKYELNDYFKGLAPIMEMGKGKQKGILQIVSKAVREFINYVFIIADKTMLSFILQKTQQEVNYIGTDDESSVNNMEQGEILDNVISMFEQYQEKNPITKDYKGSIVDYKMEDSQGTQHHLLLDVDGQDKLDKISAYMLKYVNDKEKILEKFNNFTLGQQQSLDVFTATQKKRIQLYLTFIFRPLEGYLNKILTDYSDTYIIDKIHSYFDDYISSVNINKLIGETQEDLKKITQQIQNEGGQNNALSQIMAKVKNGINNEKEKEEKTE